MKKDLYDEKDDSSIYLANVNGVVIAFVCAFLLTITVGAVVLCSIAAKKPSNVNNAGSSITEIEEDSRMPLAEKIVNETVRVPGATKIDTGQTSDEINTKDAVTESVKDTESTENIDVAEVTTPGDTDVVDENNSNSDTQNNAITDPKWEHALTPANQEYVSMAFAGDILFDPNYAIMNKIRQNGGGIEGVIGGSLLSYMRSADIMVVNNEFPYSYRGAPTEGKTFTFRADPSSAELLNQMGVDVATLANNHAYDYGEAALLDTLETIDNVGIARIGAGANLEEASHPVYYLSDNGVKIAIISATEIERIDNPDTKGATDNSPGVFRCLNIDKLLSRIKEAKATGAFVIVCIHWGTENQEAIDWWQQKQGPEIVEAGADMIVGAHPHILQKIGYINGVPVIYSLGNFLFNSRELETGLLRANIYKDGQVKLQFIPAIQSGCTVSEATGERKTAVLNHMRQMSDGISIDDEGYVQ